MVVRRAIFTEHTGLSIFPESSVAIPLNLLLILADVDDLVQSVNSYKPFFTLVLCFTLLHSHLQLNLCIFTVLTASFACGRCIHVRSCS